MIHINNISEETFNKLKICSKLIKEESKNKPLNEVIVFTDDVKTIKHNLEYIFDLNNINIKLQVVPTSYKENYMGKILDTTAILDIQILFNLFRLDFVDKTSYIKYDPYDKLMEVRTKIYESIIEGEII